MVSLVVLGDDRSWWRPQRFHWQRWGCRVSFRFPMVKLLDYARDEARLETDPNPFATLVLVHLKTQSTRGDPEARRFWKWRLIRGLFERGLDQSQIRELFRLTEWMMDLPAEQEQLFWQDWKAYQREKAMPFISTFERMEQAVREQGRQEGQREGLRKAVALGVKLKFGSAGVQWLNTLGVNLDLAQLEAILQALDTNATLDDLRRLDLEPRPTDGSANPSPGMS